jgi:hypothetical protein
MLKRNLKRIVASLIVVIAILAVGSCSVTFSGPSYIRISNTSGTYTLAHLNITTHNSSSWGSDLLAPGVITPGTALSVQVDPGYYDVWVTDTTPFDAYAYDVRVTEGNTTTLHFNGATLQ